MAAYVRYKTTQNATTFTDVTMLPLVVIHMEKIAERCVETDGLFFMVPNSENLVADTRQYSLEADLISRIIRVEAKLDGTDFINLTEVDVNEYRDPMVEADIVAKYANLAGSAFYMIYHSSIYVLSGTITAVTNGLKYWHDAYPTALTDLTSTTDMAVNASNDVHGFPRPLHEFLARAIIIDYKESREKPIALSERELSYEADLQNKINFLSKQNRDREIIGTLPDDGFGNGYNL